jgi:hypothetical protein
MKYPAFPNIPAVQFANIPGHDGYAASDDGRIWSCRHNRWGYSNVWRELVTVANNKYGRRMTQIGRASGPVYVHHLVLSAFVGPRPEGMECLHINGNAGDNRLSNLRWGTREENLADFRLHGRKKGERHHNAKVTADVVRDIRRRAAQGETHQSIADRIHVRREAVSKIVRRERWGHVQ